MLGKIILADLALKRYSEADIRATLAFGNCGRLLRIQSGRSCFNLPL